MPETSPLALTPFEIVVLVLYVVGFVLLVVGRLRGLLTVAEGVLWVVLVAFLPGLGPVALAVRLVLLWRRRRGPIS